MVWRERDVDLEDRLRIGWQQELGQQQHFPSVCIEAVMQALLRLDTQGGLCTAISWVELVFILQLTKFQFWHRPKGTWQKVGQFILEPRPNLSAINSFVRKSVHWLFGHFGMQDCIVWGLDISHLGVCQSQGGVLLGIDPEVLQKARGNGLLHQEAA